MINELKLFKRTKSLVFLSEVLLLAFALSSLGADLFVILLKGGKIFTSLREFTLLHTLTDIPVNESTLGVHEVELGIQTGPGFSNGGGVGEHANRSGNLGKITSGNGGGGLVVDSNLESGGAPIDELDGLLGLDGGNGSVDVLGNNITTVEQAAGHVLSVTRITLDHLVVGLKASSGDLSNGELLVESLLSGDNGGIVGQGEMDAGVGDQVGLELGQINVESTLKTEGGSDGGNNLADEAIEVNVGWALNVEVLAADVVDGLVVNQEGDVNVLEGGVGGQDGVVGFNN